MRSSSARVRFTAALALAAMVLVSLVPAVSADNGLQITTPYPAVAVAPGSKVSFDLTIDSTRDANVALSLGGVPTGWTASLIGGGNVVDAVAVTSGKAGTVRLDVTVPADAAASTDTIRVTGVGGGATDVLALPIRVNKEAAGDISLTTTTPSLTGSSDTTFTFDLTFKQRHRPGRDRIRGRDRRPELDHHCQDLRRGAGRIDRGQGRLDRRHGGHGEGARGYRGGQPIPSP